MTNWIIIAISVVLTAFAVYKEVKRPNKARLSWRVIAVTAAIAALACLILPVSYKSDVKGGSDSVILLTPGFVKDSLKADHQRIYTLDNSIAKSFSKAKLISNTAEILGDQVKMPIVHIYGSGLDDMDLKQLQQAQIVFHSSPVPDGVVAVNWTNYIRSGEPFQVQGSIKNSGKPFVLLLKGLNTVLDSSKISTGIAVSFSMSKLAKHAGKVLYNLVGIRDKDTLFNEQLSVVIEPSRPLKVLMLSAAPDFENKFLRTWLGNNNYAVASRAIITKGKIGQDYFNMERIDLSRVTTDLLSKFDMVEADLSAVKALPPNENAALRQEVSKGLGLIVRADTVDNQTANWVQNSLKVIRSAKQPPTELIIQNKKTAKLNVDPQFIAQQNNTQPIVTDARGNITAAAALSGAGKLVFSTINNSYSWELAGDHDDYAAYWSALINKAARKSAAENSWSVATPFPVPGEPATLSYQGAELNGPVLINGTRVAPVQNPGIPFEWQFTYWPPQPGWQRADANGQAPTAWFVWPKNSFASLRAAENARITTKYASKSTKYSSNSRLLVQKVAIEISKIYFYILLLVAVTFLWAEAKYQSQTN